MHVNSQTRPVRVGAVTIGGGAPVSVQTMTDADPHDAGALAAQVTRCAEAGADLVRLTVPDFEAARTLGEVRRRTGVPLVADIHFDHRCALAALEAGADALRLNPGNIGGRAEVQAVARAAKARGAPIRIGVNAGSLEQDIRARHGAENAAPPPEALVESALRHVRLLEDEGFLDIVVSAKASDVPRTLATYRLLAERTDCPLHLGVTEAGTRFRGTVHSAVALGALLAEGIGDTIRVSLTDRPEQEVKAGIEILRALGLRAPGPSVTSCPTCGRTKVDLRAAAARIESALESLYRDFTAPSPGSGGRAVGRSNAPTAAFPRVAVMGCAVNGPGEAKGADIALCGGTGEFLLYENGALVRKVAEAEAVSAVVEAVKCRLEGAE